MNLLDVVHDYRVAAGVQKVLYRGAKGLKLGDHGRRAVGWRVVIGGTVRNPDLLAGQIWWGLNEWCLDEGFSGAEGCHSPYGIRLQQQ